MLVVGGKVTHLNPSGDTNTPCTRSWNRTSYPRVKSPVPVHMSFEAKSNSTLRGLTRVVFYELVTVFGRVDRSRICRLSRPRRASHSENTTRLFVAHEGNAPSPHVSKTCVLLLYERAILRKM